MVQLIQYRGIATPLGEVLLAADTIGLCWLAYVADKEQGIAELQTHFSEAILQASENPLFERLETWFQSPTYTAPTVPLNLVGTPFQLEVWHHLSSIPWGQTTNYQAIATKLGQKNSARAVGTAIGKNPIAVLVPCHRVLRSDGGIGGYRWGIERKVAWLNMEGAPYLF